MASNHPANGKYGELEVGTKSDSGCLAAALLREDTE